MVDADKAEANAIREFGSTPVICYFHFCQALRRRLDLSDGGLPELELAHDQFWQALASCAAAQPKQALASLSK